MARDVESGRLNLRFPIEVADKTAAWSTSCRLLKLLKCQQRDLWLR